MISVARTAAWPRPFAHGGPLHAMQVTDLQMGQYDNELDEYALNWLSRK